MNRAMRRAWRRDIRTRSNRRSRKMTTTTPRDVDRVTIFRDDAGELRWRYRAAGNSAVLGGPEEGYVGLDDLLIDVERVTNRKTTTVLRAATLSAQVIFLCWDEDLADPMVELERPDPITLTHGDPTGAENSED